MTKPLYLAILPLTLLACVDNNDNIYVDYADIEVNVDFNQAQDNDEDIQDEEDHLDDESNPSYELEEDTDVEVEIEEEEIEEIDNTENEEELGSEIDQSEEEQVISDPIEEIEEELEEELEEEPELHDVNLTIAADDHWMGWINGEYLGEGFGFTTTSQLEFELPPGEHVLSIIANDISWCINGLIASVKLDGEIYSVTGDGQWLASKDTPNSNWTSQSFDDSDWGQSEACFNTGPWENNPTSLVQDGARWIWHDLDCIRYLGISWFRLHIIVE
jgi:hypothetical protein